MTLPEWACKRGDDFFAPQPIVIKRKVEGVPVVQDLTDPDWTYAVQARPRNPADSATFVDFTIDDDSALLEVGELLLSLPRATTATMAVGAWRIDVQTTNDAIPRLGRQSSLTFPLVIEQDITDVVDP
jgi:hypothetical protein